MIARPAQSGFSLVELSIVLVILGLLTGGILAGQSLIRASELRSISTEYNRHVAAIQTFRDKYFALPGDMKDATKFWNAADGTGSDGACYVADQSGGTATCDGNGNGTVDSYTRSPSYGNGPGATSEQFMMWKHLSNAGLIEGNFNGLALAGTAYDMVPGVNSPRTKICSTCGWTATSNAPLAFETGPFAGSANKYFARPSGYGQHFNLGTLSSSNPAIGPFVKPEEAWNLDTKIDDGKPGLGKVVAVWPNTCASGDGTNLTVDYNLASSTRACAFVFANAF